MEKIKKIIVEKSKYWYIVTFLWGVFILLNLEILSRYVPFWAVCIINIVLFGFIVFYANVVLSGYINKTNCKDEQRLSELTSSMENRINESVTQLSEQITQESESIKTIVSEKKNEIIQKIEDSNLKMTSMISDVKDSVDHNSERFTELINDFKEQNNSVIENSVSKINSNIEATQKEIVREVESDKEEIIEKISSSDILSSESFDRLRDEIDKTETSILSRMIDDYDKTEKQIDDLSINMNDRASTIDASCEELKQSTQRVFDHVSDNSESIQKMFKENTEKFNVELSNHNNDYVKSVSENHNHILEQFELLNKGLKDNHLLHTTEINNVKDQTYKIEEILVSSEENIKLLLENKTNELINNNKVLETNLLESDDNIKSLLEDKSNELISNNKMIENNLLESDDSIKSIVNKQNELLLSQNESIESNFEKTIYIITDKYDSVEKSVVGSADSIKKSVQDNYESQQLMHNELSHMVVSLISDLDEKTNNNVANNLSEIKADLASVLSESIKNSKNNLEVIEALLSLVNEDLQKIVNSNVFSIRELIQNDSDSTQTRLNDLEKNLIDKTNSIQISNKQEIKDVENSVIQFISSQVTPIINELESVKNNQDMVISTLVNSMNEKVDYLNQELIKNLNMVLTRSDENTEIISEKYDYIFNQIQLLYKENKKTLADINKAIEINHNRIDDVEGELVELLDDKSFEIFEQTSEINNLQKVIVSNYVDITDQMILTRTQIDSLNSLFVLFKKVVESNAKDEVKNDDRTETIKDPETGLTVKNTYKTNMLSFSEMFKGERKVYEILYGKKGEVLKTCNFDEKGKVITEMTYYPNGQVKERKETINGKTEISRFNENGTKKR